jgi:(p)ppGpp synthase/HD superfamily hydrolase
LAYWLVKDAHRKQSRRMTGERYFEHVRRVSYMAGIEYGYNDAHTIALGLLHDVIEDTTVPTAAIVNLFGTKMYQDILILSKDLPVFDPITGFVIGRAKIKDDVYYNGVMNWKNPSVRYIKGCDRIDNLADLGQWEPARRDKYILETNNNVLPIVRSADARMAAEIERRLAI